MASSPTNVRLGVPASRFLLTGDAYGDTAQQQAVLGIERRHTLVDQIVVNASGTTQSAVVPPAGARVLITGVGVDWSPALAGAATIALGVTTAGSGILGLADQAIGAFPQKTATLHLALGTTPGAVFSLHPYGLNLVTREGNGANALWAVLATVGVGDVFNVYVYYAPLYAKDIVC